MKLAKDAFAKLPSTPTTTEDLLAQYGRAKFTMSDVRIRDDDMAHAHVAVAFEGASWRDPDSVPLMVAQAVLGSWDKSRPSGVNQASPLAQQLATNDLANSYMARAPRTLFRSWLARWAFARSDASLLSPLPRFPLLLRRRSTPTTTTPGSSGCTSSPTTPCTSTTPPGSSCASSPA